MNTFYIEQDLRITLIMGIDVTGATCKIKYRPPGGIASFWVGTISSAATGAFYYDATPAELTVGGAGQWTFWAYATLLSGKIAIGRLCKLLISAEGT
jgi:hypothetical protein